MEAEIRLIVAQRDGVSYVRSLYTSPPFRVVSVGQLSKDRASHLMVMSTSPGVLSGDRYDINITVEHSARLRLESQSYQRIYDMDGEAHQLQSIKVEDGAHFSQVAHPIVPHRNSAFFSRTLVDLGDDSSFLQSEIITCGRRHHGEEFLFREFSNIFEIRHRGVLRLRDHVWLSPSVMPLVEIGLLEGYTHQGTMIYQTTQDLDIKGIVDDLYGMFSNYKGVSFGISETRYAGFVIRVLGVGGEVLYALLREVQDFMWAKQNLV